MNISSPTTPFEQNAEPKKWTIVGSGAMGCLWASTLALAGNEVTIIVKNKTEKKHPCIQLYTQQKSSPQQALVATKTAAQLSKSSQHIEYLLITTKVFDAIEAFDSIIDCLGPTSWVGTVFNGLGVHDAIATKSPSPFFFAGVSTDGALLNEPFSVIHTGVGQTTFGRYQPTVNKAGIENADSQPVDTRYKTLPFTHDFSLNTCIVDDIEPFMWQKFLVNCAINPLTALLACKNGELLSNPNHYRKLQAIVEELIAFARKTRIPVAIDELANTIEDVAKHTAENQSSMLRDVINGRQTEINDLTGYLLKLAREADCKMPKNQTLFEQLKNHT